MSSVFVSLSLSLWLCVSLWLLSPPWLGTIWDFARGFGTLPVALSLLWTLALCVPEAVSLCGLVSVRIFAATIAV